MFVLVWLCRLQVCSHDVSLDLFLVVNSLFLPFPPSSSGWQKENREQFSLLPNYWLFQPLFTRYRINGEHCLHKFETGDSGPKLYTAMCGLKQVMRARNQRLNNTRITFTQSTKTLCLYIHSYTTYITYTHTYTYATHMHNIYMYTLYIHIPHTHPYLKG